MAEGNQLCEIPNCSDPVTAFGLKGTLKLRTCSQHIGALLAKGMSIYSIDKFAFVSSQQDAAVYDERKATVDMGLGNLAVLEANVDTEYEAALQLLESKKRALIETIETKFFTIREEVTGRRDEVKKHFSSLAENLRQYIQNRESALLPSAELLCGVVKKVPSFIRLDIEGISNPVSSAIDHHWSVSADDIEPLLLTAVSGSSLPITVETASTFNQKGIAFYLSKKWKNAEEYFLKAKVIYEMCGSRSDDAASNLNLLGLLFTEMQKLNEAEESFREAQAMLESSSPQPAEAGRTHHYYALLCLKLGRADDAQRLYQQAKAIYEATGVQPANLFEVVSKLGLYYGEQKQFDKAVEFYRQALQLIETKEPQSTRAAVIWFQIGLCYIELKQWKESEECFLRAKAIYETSDSTRDEYEKCLNNLGFLYEVQNRLEESITSFQASMELCVQGNDSEGKARAEANFLRVQTKLANATSKA